MRRIYLTAILISILILFSALVYLYLNNQEFIKARILRKVSRGEIFIQDDQLKINFQIIDEDKSNLNFFSNTLEVNQDWINGISIILDPNTISNIKQHFPVQADLKFKEKELDFNSSFTSNLSSSLPGQNYQISTGSAKLVFTTQGGSDFNLDVDEPDAIIKYATSSGKLYLSLKIQQLFPMLSKIAKIRLVVRNKNLAGQILLK